MKDLKEKEREIEDTLLELRLWFKPDANFVKKQKNKREYYNFDYYVPVPHKIIINLCSDIDIDFLSSCGFTVLDFSADIDYDYFSLIKGSLSKEKSRPKKNKKKSKKIYDVASTIIKPQKKEWKFDPNYEAPF